MDVKTILWPTDLSKKSVKAAPHVVEMAQKYGAKVVVLYVAVDLCSYFPAYGNYPSGQEIEKFQSWEMENAKKRLEKVCEEEFKACPNLEMKLVTGKAAESILQTAKAEDVDMIAMTGSDYEHIDSGHVQFSEVARKVVEQSPVPVQIIK
ncbi:universal stress protein [Desulfohalovibrio reitneri]|uniref:universal stress protein n=1 Tax=Desulfohalovibrio reitneri TaxID=1307759 RepID=UPI0004A6AE30|nr:universal stress protein [Desulfohalovibrio reitneri]